MKKSSCRFIVLSVLFLIPVSVFAHPGHGETDGHTIIHYFTEPIHAAATISGILLLALGYYAFFRNKKQDIKAK